MMDDRRFGARFQQGSADVKQAAAETTLAKVQ
jgi:hypothetical protein